MLWLVRQGEADASTGTPLTVAGRRQADRVASLLGAKEIAVVYSGDDDGARATAAVIAGRLGCEVATDRRLRRPEEGLSDPALHATYAGVVDSIEARRHQGDVVIVAHRTGIRMLRAAASGAPASEQSGGSSCMASVCRVVLPAPARPAQVGTAPTRSSTWTPSPGSETRLVASP